MPVLAMMIAPASRRFFVSVASYGGTMPSNASAPPVVGMSVVWMLSLSAIGMPCSGPRTRPCARSRSSASASSSAFGFTVIAACSRSSYVAMRVRYCCTSSCDVVRPAFIAACMSAMLASTTVNGGGLAFGMRGAAAWPPANRRSATRGAVCFMARKHSRVRRRSSRPVPSAIQDCRPGRQNARSVGRFLAYEDARVRWSRQCHRLFFVRKCRFRSALFDRFLRARYSFWIGDSR